MFCSCTSSTLNDPDFYDPDIRAYLDPTQQVQEEITKKYSLSRFELNWCRKFNIKQLESSENYASKKELHIALSKYYKELKVRSKDSSNATNNRR